MPTKYRKMIIVAYFSQQCFSKRFHHLYINLPDNKKFRNTNLIIQVDYANEQMQVFSEYGLMKRKKGITGKSKVMKFKDKNIHLIDLSQNQHLEFPPEKEELEIFFPSRTGNFNIDQEEVLEHLERIFGRG